MKRMSYKALDWTVFLVFGLMVLTEVSTRSTPSSNANTVAYSTPSSTSVGVAISKVPDKISTPEPTTTATSSTTTATSSTTSLSSTGRSSNVQAQTESTVSTLSTTPIQPEASAVAANSGSRQCPHIPDIADELCMMQTKLTSFPCDRDGDCFLQNHICCPHFCGRKICKDLNGPSDASPTTDSSKKPKPKRKTVPTYIKHPQNVPTIDDLVENYKDVGQISSNATLSPSSSSSASVVEQYTSSVSPPSTTQIPVQPSMTSSGESSTTSTQLSSTTSLTSMKSTAITGMTPSSSIATKVTTSANEAVTSSSGVKKECPVLACTTTCQYGTKVDALGCPVCECMFNDKCPPVLPIPRMLCTLKLRTTSFTCDLDSDCLQGHICCPGACAGNVCRRVVRETFRTLTISKSG